MRSSQIPGPDGGLLGYRNIMAFQHDPLDFLTRLTRTYGDIVHLRFGTQDIYFLTRPDFVQEILVNQWQKLIKWERLKTGFLKVAPLNLVILEGDIWQQTRRMTMPAFHQQRLEAYVAAMSRHAGRISAQWQDGTSYAMNAFMTDAVMGVLGEVLFDIPHMAQTAPELAHALDARLHIFMGDVRSIVQLPDWLPTPRNQQRRQVTETIRKHLMTMIQQRRQTGQDTGDVLSALMQAADPVSGKTFDDEEVYQLVLSFFMAGRETPVRALTWALYLLAQHPAIQEQLYQEVASAAPLTWDQLAAMPYLQQVVQETLRLYPPTWALVFRQVIEPVQLGEYSLPVGAVVYISPYVLHHDPRWWQNPEQFNPANFSAGWQERVPAYAYVPFGGGA